MTTAGQAPVGTLQEATAGAAAERQVPALVDADAALQAATLGTASQVLVVLATAAAVDVVARGPD